VREHGDLMTAAGERLDELSRELLRDVHAVAWIGPDADDFRGEAQQSVDRLLQWSHGCREAATRLVDEVQEQDDASTADSGGGLLDSFAAAVSAGIDALGQLASD